MNSIELALQGAGRVLLAGLLFGAGLPVVYALAMRALTLLLIAVLVGAVVLGLVMIVATGFGKTVSFEHLIPSIVDKK